jgi:transcriptional regulator with XRE-family HTH domain
MPARSFGERLKQLREEEGLTQVELAAAAGLHRFAVAKLEVGSRQPTWATVQALARALDVEVTAFVIAPPPEAEKPSRQKRKGG